jgi:hypothetical protein
MGTYLDSGVELVRCNVDGYHMCIGEQPQVTQCILSKAASSYNGGPSIAATIAQVPKAVLYRSPRSQTATCQGR